MEIVGPFHITIGAYPDTDASVETNLIRGCITAIGVMVHDTGGDITVTAKGNAGMPEKDLFAKTGVNASAWFYPSVQRQTSAGVDIAGAYDAIPVYDYLTILIENSTGDEEFDVVFLVE